MPNDLLVTTTDILGIEVAKDYSGASGIYVDNVNNIISITGDVGKEYNGIEPIVVNNEENLISANSAPIGVQEPLYFVQDDDEAVIIGFSGDYVTPSDIAGKMDTSSFESWQQGQYTNDLTAINEKINEVSSSIPSIEGLATEQLVEETSASIVSQIPSTAGLASETYVQEQTSAKASKSDLETVSGDIVNLIPDVSNFYTKNETSGAEQLAEAFANIPGGEGDEEVNALVHSNSATWNEVSSKLDESTFQEASGLFLTAIPPEYVTESDIPNFISAKLDTDVFADVSGSFLTAVDLTPYVPASAIGKNILDYITAISGFDISAKRAVNAEVAGYSNSASRAYRDSNGNLITAYYQPKLDFSGTNGTITAINSSAVAGDMEVNQAVHTNSATWNTVTDKLDTTAQVVTGYTTNKNLINTINGSYISAQSAYKSDTSKYASYAEFDYYGAPIIMDNYQTTAGMTAYQPAGSYVTTNELEQVSADITVTIPSTAGLASESYVQTNSAVLTGMIDGKQDTLTFGYDEQDRINQINSSAIAGGTDLVFTYVEV